MKKLILSAAVLLCGITASAGIEDVRIYINPGHGAFCSSCRAMPTVKHGAVNYSDTTGFYESNTNLQKGLALFHKLKEYGVKHNASNALDLTQNLVMSRIKSGDVHNGLYDRALSEIAEEAELNNFDMFISIHSNASSDGSTTNYPLYLYRGTDAAESCSGSIAMAKACWPYSIENPHLMWTHYTTSTNIRGDITYMGSSYTTTHSNGKSYVGYYGVLRHGVPGFLVEGYFHTYQPARHKYMNWDVCHMEGIGYAKGINDYFGWGKKETTGYIFGILRDAEETFSHTYYTPNTSTLDNYKPINNATVTLKNSAGAVVATYTTDDEYNGAFVFKNVEPGTYTLTYSHPDYKDASESVTVVANEVVYPTPQISSSTEVVAVQGHYAYGLSMSQDGTTYTLKFKSTGAVDNGYIILTSAATGATQTISLGAVAAGENTVTVDATTLGEDALFNWSVALDNPKSTATALIYSDSSAAYNNGSYYANGGVAIDKDTDSDYFGTIYTSTGYAQGIQAYNPDFTKSGSKILGSGFNSANSSSPFRIATSEGKLYITDWSDAHGGLWVYNPANGASVSNMFTGTNDGKGCIVNGSTVTGGGTTGVSFTGKGSARQMYVFCEDYPTGNAGNILLRYDLGTSDSWSTSPSASFSTVAASSLMANANVEVLTSGYGVFCAQTRYTGNNTSANPSFVHMATDGTVNFNSGSSLSVHDGSNLGAMALYENTFAIADANGCVNIYSITWSSGTPSMALLYSITLSGTTNICQLDFDHAGNLYVFSKQTGLNVYAIKNAARQTVTDAKSSLQIQGVVQPAVRGHYAYDLNMETLSSTYTLTFKSTGAADNAYIILTDANNSSNVTKIGIGSVVEGENTVTIDRSELAQDTKFNWAVEIENPSSPSVEQTLSDNSIVYYNGSYYSRGGIAIDKDTESDNFGTIYTSIGSSFGIQKYNPDLTKDGSPILSSCFGSNIHSPYRIETNGGKLYISDHSADYAGVWVYDPAAGESVTNVFVGTNDGNGQIVNGSTATGGQATSVAFIGEGADRKMYIFSQDVPTVNASNKLLRYDIGESDSWATAPSAQFDAISAKMANANVEILATENGIFCSQTRYTNNNTTDVPAFAVMSADGTITFNSGNLTSLNGCNGGGMAIFDNIFAIVNGDGNIDIFTMTWSGSTPSFTHCYTIAIDGTTEINQLDFDIAGNLYAFSRQQGLLVYTIRTDARSTRTDAKAALLLEYASATGIGNIGKDNGSTTAEYYNLQGIKVSSEEINSGIYIRVQDGKASTVKITR